ncbi:hypothetical protein ACFL56_02250, partial [Candidatus Margulisiibacteriota bacterium]
MFSRKIISFIDLLEKYKYYKIADYTKPIPLKTIKVDDNVEDKITTFIINSQKKIVICGLINGEIRIYNFEGEKIKIIHNPELKILKMCCSPDNVHLVCAFDDNTIHIYNLENYALAYQIAVNKIKTRKISKFKTRKKSIVLMRRKPKMKLHPTDNRKKYHYINYKRIYDIFFTLNNKYLIVASNLHIQIFDKSNNYNCIHINDTNTEVKGIYYKDNILSTQNNEMVALVANKNKKTEELDESLVLYQFKDNTIITTSGSKYLLQTKYFKKYYKEDNKTSYISHKDGIFERLIRYTRFYRAPDIKNNHALIIANSNHVIIHWTEYDSYRIDKKDRNIKIIDFHHKKELKDLTINEIIMFKTFKITPDKKHFYFATLDQDIYIYNIQSGKQVGSIKKDNHHNY